jgi:hypothetical protein
MVAGHLMTACGNGLRDGLLFPLHATLAVPPHDFAEGGFTAFYLGNMAVLDPLSGIRRRWWRGWLPAARVWISQPGPGPFRPRHHQRRTVSRTSWFKIGCA